MGWWGSPYVIKKGVFVFVLEESSEIINKFFFFCFLGPHPRHMQVSRLGVELELQLPGYATATATSDLSCVCDIHHSSGQHCIFNSLREARDQTYNLMDPSRVC